MIQITALGLVLTLLPSLAEAQQSNAIVDHWATEAECRASEHAPFYVPSITSTKALGKNEVILPHPTGGCFEIELPDRITKGFPDEGWGWIRVERGREVVFHSKTGKALKIAKCDNRIRRESPFSIPGVSPNPFEVLEETRVVADLNIADQGRRAASELAADLDRQDRRRGDGPAWWHWERKTGKILWVGVPAAIIATAVVCSKTDLCQGNRVKQIVIIGG